MYSYIIQNLYRYLYNWNEYKYYTFLTCYSDQGYLLKISNIEPTVYYLYLISILDRICVIEQNTIIIFPYFGLPRYPRSPVPDREREIYPTVVEKP